MEIIVGKNAGFCYGVKRAVEGARQETKKAVDSIFCLGEIVHNKQVVNSLKELGVHFIEDYTQAKGNLLIRSHGIAKSVYKSVKEMGVNVVDFTCTKVLKIHELAEEYAKKNYYILLCGSKNHPENIGTISYCGKNFSVIEDEENVDGIIEELKKNKIEKILLISQTTFSLEKFENIEKIIREKMPKTISMEVKNTICMTTRMRQKETEEIAKNVDYMIIIGGKNSSNTQKLFQIAKQNCPKAVSIETVQELDEKEVKKYDRIGIMAGASTPRESIEQVQNVLLGKKLVSV